MKKSSNSEADPDRAAILNLLDFPQPLSYDRLTAIKPDEWTNVGPSVCHGFNIMLQ